MSRFNKKVAIVMSLCLMCSLASFAQHITLNASNITVKQAMNRLQRASGYSFVFYSSDVNTSKKVSINAENEPLAQVIDQILTGQDLTYQIKGKSIVISKKETSPQSSTAINRKENKSSKAVQGRVIDSNGDPIIGASIIIKGRKAQGTITDAEGHFMLTNVPNNGSLEISYVGFSTVEIPVHGKTSFEITMKEDAKELDEVVAIGYGTQRKITLTGSTASTTGKALEANSSVNLSQGLAGRLSGVIINNRSGEPGKDDAIMYIRGRSTLGNNNPLIIIDGIAGRDAEFSRLSPDEIESVTVLKDASAAIYGSRSANGVILVTTKRGTTSGKPTIDFTYDLGLQQPTRLPDMADAILYAKAVNASNAIDGEGPRYTDEDIQKFDDGSDPILFPNTDWYDEVIKNLSIQHKYGVTARGGTSRFNYFASLNGQYQDGIYRKSATNYKQYNMRTNLDFMITDWLKIGFDMSAREQHKNYSAFPSDDYGIFYVTQRALPTGAPYYPDGRLRGGLNPAIMVQSTTGYDKTTIHSLNTTLTGSIDLNKWVKGLTLTGHLAYDKNNSFGKNWKTPWNYWTYDEVSKTFTEQTSTYWPSAQLDESYVGWHRLTLNGQINYDRVLFNSHHVSLMFGAEQSEYHLDRFSAGRSHFGSDALDQLFAGDADHTYWSNTGSANETARRSFFGRVNYDYLSKYLISFICRWDGSENFPKGKRWGFFPGVSAGWRISEEKFVKDKWGSWLSNLKLRASYGEQGNDNIDPFQYMTTYSYSTSSWYRTNYITMLNGADANIIIPGVVGNPDVTWEVAKTWNIGLDGDILNGLFNWEIEFFHTSRSNILVTRNASVPSYTGLTSLPDENIGKVTNHGFELQLGHQKRINKDFLYSIKANVLYAKNKIVYMDETPWGEGHEYLNATGHPMGSHLYYHVIGINKTQDDLTKYPQISGATLGEFIYEDIDGDGKITSYDRKRDDLTAVPQIVFGTTFNAQWKNFDITMLLQGQARAHFYDAPLIDWRSSNIYAKAAKKAWTLDRPDSNYPRIGQRHGEADYWAKSASFLRLKNVEIGYTLPKTWLASMGVTACRIYVAGYNLLTFSGLKDVDPENSDEETQTYPQTRVYNFGIKITF